MSVDRVAVRGVELAVRRWGEGGPVAVHETASSAAIWHPLAEALGGLIAHDRRGWGDSEAPPDYLRTTIEEHAEDLVALLASLGAEPRTLIGAGLGAVVALNVGVRHAELVRELVLVEPPLLAFVPEAAEGLAADRERLAEISREGGATAAVDAYLRGDLPWFGPGAERLPPEVSSAARERPRSLFAELAAVPSWSIPFADLRQMALPLAIVTGRDTPAALLAAADALSDRVATARRVELDRPGLPHYEGADELASVIARAP